MPVDAHLDVINEACVGIGVTPLGSDGMDEDSDVGQKVQFAYNTVLGFNLDQYQFSWSRTIMQLSLVNGATPLSGYLYVFDVPPEAIGEPIYVTDDVTDPKRRFAAYVLLGRTIEASKSPLYAQIRYRPDPVRWSPSFRAATVTALQASLAQSHRQDSKLSADLHEKAYGPPSADYRGGQYGAAIKADAFATPPRKPNWDNNPLTRAYTGDGVGSTSEDC